MKKFLAIWLLFLAGCSSTHRAHSPPEVALVEWSPLVAATLAAETGGNIFVVDVSYLSLTDPQIDSMLSYVDKRRHRGRYLPELWDCDDMAREFRVLASDWAVTTFKDAPAGLAVAELFVKVSGNIDSIGDYGAGGLHAMVAVRRVDGVWFLVEPGNCKRTPLLGPIYEGNLEVKFIHL